MDLHTYGCFPDISYPKQLLTPMNDLSLGEYTWQNEAMSLETAREVPGRSEYHLSLFTSLTKAKNKQQNREKLFSQWEKNTAVFSKEFYVTCTPGDNGSNWF